LVQEVIREVDVAEAGDIAEAEAAAAAPATAATTHAAAEGAAAAVADEVGFQAIEVVLSANLLELGAMVGDVGAAVVVSKVLHIQRRIHVIDVVVANRGGEQTPVDEFDRIAIAAAAAGAAAAGAAAKAPAGADFKTTCPLTIDSTAGAKSLLAGHVIDTDNHAAIFLARHGQGVGKNIVVMAAGRATAGASDGARSGVIALHRAQVVGREERIPRDLDRAWDLALGRCLNDLWSLHWSLHG